MSTPIISVLMKLHSLLIIIIILAKTQSAKLLTTNTTSKEGIFFEKIATKLLTTLINEKNEYINEILKRKIVFINPITRENTLLASLAQHWIFTLKNVFCLKAS